MSKTAQSNGSKIRKRVHANHKEFVAAADGQNLFCKLSEVLASCVKGFNVDKHRNWKIARKAGGILKL